MSPRMAAELRTLADRFGMPVSEFLREVIEIGKAPAADRIRKRRQRERAGGLKRGEWMHERKPVH